MALSKITFNVGEGGLGTPLATQDHISGYIHYSDTLPSGFGTSDRIKRILSIDQAESLGITDNSTDETAATDTYTVTGAGAEGDTIKMEVSTETGIVLLGTTVVPATPTTTTVGDAIEATINGGTSTHGFTASNAAGTVTVTAPVGKGLGANTYTTTLTLVGSVTVTKVDFSGGVASEIDIMHYHISEYFRMQPDGELFVGIFAVPVSHDFADIPTVQTFASGTIRQFGVYQKDTAFATSQTTSLQVQADALEVLKQPIQIIYQAEISGTSDLSTLPTLATLSNNNVSVTIAQDSAARGGAIFFATGKSIGTVGNTLGSVSLSSVEESIAWVQEFNISNGTELEILAMANGNLISALTVNLLEVLDDQRYIFGRTFVGVSGSFYNAGYSAIVNTSDFATIQNNRTIQKAIRGVNASLTPQLNSPVLVNADGTLQSDTITFFKVTAERPLNDMLIEGNISAFEVLIDANQDILSTQELVVTVRIIPVGVAKFITVNIGFTTALT